MLLLSFGSRAAPVLAQGTADLAVTIVADRDKLNPHEQITFTIVATNRGPDDAVLVDVYHYLPDQLQFVSLTCDRGISPDTPACEYQSLAAGASVTSVLVATLKAAPGKQPKVVTTTAQMRRETSDTVDPNPSNDSASVSIKLNGRLSP